VYPRISLEGTASGQGSDLRMDYPCAARQAADFFPPSQNPSSRCDLQLVPCCLWPCSLPRQVSKLRWHLRLIDTWAARVQR